MTGPSRILAACPVVEASPMSKAMVEVQVRALAETSERDPEPELQQ